MHDIASIGVASLSIGVDIKRNHVARTVTAVDAMLRQNIYKYTGENHDQKSHN